MTRLTTGLNLASPGSPKGWRSKCSDFQLELGGNTLGEHVAFSTGTWRNHIKSFKTALKNRWGLGAAWCCSKYFRIMTTYWHIFHRPFLIWCFFSVEDPLATRESRGPQFKVTEGRRSGLASRKFLPKTLPPRDQGGCVSQGCKMINFLPHAKILRLPITAALRAPGAASPGSHGTLFSRKSGPRLPPIRRSAGGACGPIRATPSTGRRSCSS